MHALLDARGVVERVEEAAQHRSPGAGERIEHPHLDVGLEGETHDERIAPGTMEVVEQDAHAHTAPGGFVHGPEQPAGAGVGMDGVVLEVEGLLRALDQSEPAAIGELRAVEQQEAGFETRAGGIAALLHQRRKRGTGRRGECGGDRPLHVLGQLRAGADEENDAQCHAPTA